MHNKKYLMGIVLATGSLMGIYNEQITLADNNIQKSSKVIVAGNTSLVGVNSETTKAKSSEKYFNYFKEYGETYGIDPYLLMAIASTESAGNPSAKNGNNYGLMQINFTGSKKTVKAFNFKTNKFDSITITSSSQLLGNNSVWFNIKVGAMQLQEKARELEFNPLASIQGYNFGQNGFKRAITYYLSNGNILQGNKIALNDIRVTSYIKSNDTQWITKKFNGKTALQLYTSNGGGGTASYVSEVLGYYRDENKQPWIMDLNSNKYIVNGVKTNEKPDIIREDYDIYIGDTFNPKNKVKAIDLEDGDLTRYLVVTNNTVDTSKQGDYNVSYAILDSDGNRTDKSFVTVVKAKSNEKPEINVDNISLNVGDTFNPLKNVTATDKEDGDLTRYLVVTNNTVDTSKKGVYKVSYAILDSDGNRTDKTITVEVKALSNNPPQIIIENKEQLLGETINPLENAIAYDDEDGDLTRYLIVTKDTTNNQEKGTYTISYAVLDSDGNRTDKTIFNTVK